MGAYEVLRLLRGRRGFWERERANSAANGKPDFLNGIMLGLTEAVGIAEECHRIARKGKYNWRNK